MTRRELTVRGQGPEVRARFFIEVYQGKVWVTSFSCPDVCVAILEPAQADSLVALINQATKEARGYRNGSPS